MEAEVLFEFQYALGLLAFSPKRMSIVALGRRARRTLGNRAKMEDTMKGFDNCM